MERLRINSGFRASGVVCPHKTLDPQSLLLGTIPRGKARKKNALRYSLKLCKNLCCFLQSSFRAEFKVVSCTTGSSNSFWNSGHDWLAENVSTKQGMIITSITGNMATVITGRTWNMTLMIITLVIVNCRTVSVLTIWRSLHMLLCVILHYFELLLYQQYISFTCWYLCP